jgi:hypothetical protein
METDSKNEPLLVPPGYGEPHRLCLPLSGRRGNHDTLLHGPKAAYF